jgi:hypothetical protein
VHTSSKLPEMTYQAPPRPDGGALSGSISAAQLVGLHRLEREERGGREKARVVASPLSVRRRRCRAAAAPPALPDRERKVRTRATDWGFRPQDKTRVFFPPRDEVDRE